MPCCRIGQGWGWWFGVFFRAAPRPEGGRRRGRCTRPTYVADLPRRRSCRTGDRSVPSGCLGPGAEGLEGEVLLGVGAREGSILARGCAARATWAERVIGSLVEAYLRPPLTRHPPLWLPSRGPSNVTCRGGGRAGRVTGRSPVGVSARGRGAGRRGSSRSWGSGGVDPSPGARPEQRGPKKS